MADELEAVYRFRGRIKPSAEVKQPVRAFRNASDDKASGDKSTSATIDIFDVIDSWGGWWGISAGEVDKALASLGGDIETLFVRVNSPGGEATEGVAIANLLRAHAAAIHVTVYGLAASAASYISTAGDTVAMAPGSMMMIHDAWNVVRGDAAAMRAQAAVLDTLSNSVASLYALKAGGSVEDWRALMVAETWYAAADAVTAGLADKVGIDQSPTPVNGDDQAVPLPDADDSPFDMAAKTFDLSVFAHAPAASASRAPSATAVPTHSTGTSTSPWDGPAAEKNLKSPMSLATAKKAYAWYAGGSVDNGQVTKANCKFPHHFVSADGTPGKASTKACQSIIGILNGGMGGADIPSSDVQGVYNHAAKHLRDANLTPAPLTLKLPASESEHPMEGAVMLTDSEIKAFVERLGLPEDADSATVQAKLDELEEAATKPAEPSTTVTDEAIAEHFGVPADKVKAAVDAAKTGKVTISQVKLDELESMAKDGAEARAKQRVEERDAAVQAAWEQGKISADRRESWAKAWDVDSEGTKADLESLEVRFPVAKAAGYAGSDGTDGEGTKPFSDEEAAALAQLGGISKEGLLA